MSSGSLLASGTFAISPVALCTPSRMDWLNGLCVLQNICWRNVHKTRQTQMRPLSTYATRPERDFCHQRLFSQCTRAFIPMTKAMYMPKVELHVHRALTQARRREKAYYGKSARPLPTLQPGETVRIQTQRSYDRLATVLGPATQPNSHQFKAGDATYTRNQRYLLQVP